MGVVQGPPPAVARMRRWLTMIGSPASRIDECRFHDERTISKLEFSAFDVIRPKKKARMKRAKGGTGRAKAL